MLSPELLASFNREAGASIAAIEILLDAADQVLRSAGRGWNSNERRDLELDGAVMALVHAATYLTHNVSAVTLMVGQEAEQDILPSGATLYRAKLWKELYLLAARERKVKTKKVVDK